jgi:hypothetical protein
VLENSNAAKLNDLFTNPNGTNPVSPTPVVVDAAIKLLNVKNFLGHPRKFN